MIECDVNRSDICPRPDLTTPAHEEQTTCVLRNTTDTDRVVGRHTAWDDIGKPIWMVVPISIERTKNKKSRGNEDACYDRGALLFF